MALPTLKPKTYRYVGSRLHIFSSLLLIVFLVIAWMALAGPSPNDPAVIRQSGAKVSLWAEIVGVIVVLGFLASGIWIQATCWLEKITLGPDGIESYGWNGKLKLRAQLGEIKSIDVERSGKLDVMTIETMKGRIKATSHLRGFNDLAKQVNDVIESFNEGLKPLPRSR